MPTQGRKSEKVAPRQPVLALEQFPSETGPAGDPRSGSTSRCGGDCGGSGPSLRAQIDEERRVPESAGVAQVTLGDARRYLEDQWSAVGRFVEGGRRPSDNNVWRTSSGPWCRHPPSRRGGSVPSETAG